MRIAHAPYLNSALFYATLTDEPGYEFIETVPRQLGRLASEGRVDAGPMAVADYFRQQDRFELIGDLGIAVRRAAGSVLLFARCPRDQLSGRLVCATEDTSTSLLLLKLLLEERCHQRPQRYLQTDAPNGCDAWLAIGDAALRDQAALARRWPFITDLGAAWWEWQLLPFVFAVWVVRRDAAASEKRRLMQALQASLAQGLSRQAEIVARYAASLNLSAATLEQYLSQYTFAFGEEERRGMQRFHHLLLERELL